jgi:hypothetical protein
MISGASICFTNVLRRALNYLPGGANLKTCFLTLLLILCSSAYLAGQDEPKPVRQTSFIESRQGNHPDGPDVIGHATISIDDTLMCMLVEVYDETHQASTACVVKFKDGTKHVLTNGQFVKSAVDGEVALECSGRVPRRCMIEVNDPVNQSPGRQGGSGS